MYATGTQVVLYIRVPFGVLILRVPYYDICGQKKKHSHRLAMTVVVCCGFSSPAFGSSVHGSIIIIMIAITIIYIHMYMYMHIPKPVKGCLLNYEEENKDMPSACMLWAGHVHENLSACVGRCAFAVR